MDEFGFEDDTDPAQPFSWLTGGPDGLEFDDFLVTDVTESSNTDPYMPIDPNLTFDPNMSLDLDLPFNVDMSLDLGLPIDPNMSLDLDMPLDFNMPTDSAVNPVDLPNTAGDGCLNESVLPLTQQCQTPSSVPPSLGQYQHHFRSYSPAAGLAVAPLYPDPTQVANINPNAYAQKTLSPLPAGFDQGQHQQSEAVFDPGARNNYWTNQMHTAASGGQPVGQTLNKCAPSSPFSFLQSPIQDAAAPASSFHPPNTQPNYESQPPAAALPQVRGQPSAGELALPVQRPATTALGVPKRLMVPPHLVSSGLKLRQDREAKKSGHPLCDPRNVYLTPTPIPSPWGSLTTKRQHLFAYTEQAQWIPDRTFNIRHLREYITTCPRNLIMWVQTSPAQSAQRLDKHDSTCRWVGCPVNSGKIIAGWLRVVFDEYPTLTSTGMKDPFKVAGAMHLWCLEQCFDIVELYASGMLMADDRVFPREDSLTSLTRDHSHRVRDAFHTWFNPKLENWEKNGPVELPRDHKDSLSYSLISYHLNHQAYAREKARKISNMPRAEHEVKTINVHQGDLGLYTKQLKQTNAARKAARTIASHENSPTPHSPISSSGDDTNKNTNIWAGYGARLVPTTHTPQTPNPSGDGINEQTDIWPGYGARLVPPTYAQQTPGQLDPLTLRSSMGDRQPLASVQDQALPSNQADTNMSDTTFGLNSEENAREYESLLALVDDAVMANTENQEMSGNPLQHLLVTEEAAAEFPYTPSLTTDAQGTGELESQQQPKRKRNKEDGSDNPNRPKRNRNNNATSTDNNIKSRLRRNTVTSNNDSVAKRTRSRIQLPKA